MTPVTSIANDKTKDSNYWDSDDHSDVTFIVSNIY